MLRENLVLTVVIVASLAIGIGANDPAALIAGSCAFEFCQTEIEQLGLPGLDDEDRRR